ncbi:uncharacterized protein BYT42DRAFT_404451 [Radiomyces spectabilis]|uniref:uncharacterized protein n=1 Tax=Radiomyces spectabilis TaxID=64574 RepID=UPI00221F06B6|nr:uncharacterized protein BYT42DRAFT_404451 [Radiomyces spectabilis]KAI8374438.1 hypothetical protein BYT42DRAFT_404451 [Radiomyces spectabilis]
MLLLTVALPEPPVLHFTWNTFVFRIWKDQNTGKFGEWATAMGRFCHLLMRDPSFALVTLKTAIEFLKGDPLSLHDAGSAASVHSTNSSSSAIISPQIHSLRTRSTSFGSPISSPPPSSATQVSSAFSSPHYRSISISSQSMTTNHHHHHQHLTTPKTSSSHSLTSATMPSHPAFTRVLRHRKSQSADLHGMADSSPSLPPTIDDEFPQQERNRRNSLTPNVIVRPPIVLPSQRENRKSLDIPNDWMLPMKQSQTPPPSYSSSSSSSCVHYDPPSHFSPKLKHAAIGHTQPMVSTTFPSLSCSTPLPAAASDRTPESHKMSRLDEFPILVGETGMSESPKLARSLSSTSAIKKRSSALPQPPKVINIGERLSFDGARRPASICLDTRSLRNLRDDEQDQDMLGDFLRGLQNMDGDIVGERSGSFRTFRRL